MISASGVGAAAVSSSTAKREVRVAQGPYSTASPALTVAQKSAAAPNVYVISCVDWATSEFPPLRYSIQYSTGTSTSKTILTDVSASSVTEAFLPAGTVFVHAFVSDALGVVTTIPQLQLTVTDSLALDTSTTTACERLQVAKNVSVSLLARNASSSSSGGAGAGAGLLDRIHIPVHQLLQVIQLISPSLSSSSTGATSAACTTSAGVTLDVAAESSELRLFFLELLNELLTSLRGGVGATLAQQVLAVLQDLLSSAVSAEEYTLASQIVARCTDAITVQGDSAASLTDPFFQQRVDGAASLLLNLVANVGATNCTRFDELSTRMQRTVDVQLGEQIPDDARIAHEASTIVVTAQRFDAETVSALYDTALRDLVDQNGGVAVSVPVRSIVQSNAGASTDVRVSRLSAATCQWGAQGKAGAGGVASVAVGGDDDDDDDDDESPALSCGSRDIIQLVATTVAPSPVSVHALPEPFDLTMRLTAGGARDDQ
jgi:hypothetical protein